MNVRFDFPDGTLSTEHQALLEALNQFLVTLPDDEHQEVAIRLGMELLELANVALQEEIARAAGYSERTLTSSDSGKRVWPGCLTILSPAVRLSPLDRL